MADLMYRNSDYTLDTEIPLTRDNMLDIITEINIALRTTATAGDRAISCEIRANTAAIYEMANALQDNVYTMFAKLDDDDGVADEDYESGAGAKKPAATSLATGYVLANNLKAIFNLALAKLDLDTGVDSVDYAAVCTVAAADSNTRATLITLLNDLLACFHTLLGKLDVDDGVTDEDYQDVADVTLNALFPTTAFDASDVVAPSSEVTLRFEPGVSNHTDSHGNIHTALIAYIPSAERTSLFIYDKNAVDANDRMTVYIEAVHVLTI